MTSSPLVKPASHCSGVHGSAPSASDFAMCHWPGGRLNRSSGRTTFAWLAGTSTTSCAWTADASASAAAEMIQNRIRHLPCLFREKCAEEKSADPSVQTRIYARLVDG